MVNIFYLVKNKIKNRISRFVNFEVQKTMEYMLPQLIQFQNSAKEERQSFYIHTNDPFGNASLYSQLKERLSAIDVPVEEVEIDIQEFEHWLISFPEINIHYRNMGDVHIEKCLEHYLAYRFLNINKDDLYIDIAASGSQWTDVLNNRGIKSFKLDLSYPAGIHRKSIGADAGNTKLPDGFATVLSAQCAYECFMGDADIRFVKEASRIIKGEGRYGIVPLYLETEYTVSTSPYCNQQDVIIESEAKRVWRDDEYNDPFSRYYSPEIFKSRIYSAIPDNMDGKVLYFKNLPNVMKHFEGQRIYCFFMFFCEKRSKPSK